jgi:hypothetical protein
MAAAAEGRPRDAFAYDSGLLFLLFVALMFGAML